MSTEINTRGMIRTKISSFPLGNDNECMTKAEILSIGGENIRVEGQYSDTECVMMDHIQENVITWNYYFTVSSTSLTFASTGESKLVSITSYRRKAINGVETGEQEDVGYSYVPPQNGFSLESSNPKYIIAAFNSTLNVRNSSVEYIQNESSKSVSVNLTQLAGIINLQNGTYNLYITIEGGVTNHLIGSYNVTWIDGDNSSLRRRFNMLAYAVQNPFSYTLYNGFGGSIQKYTGKSNFSFIVNINMKTAQGEGFMLAGWTSDDNDGATISTYDNDVQLSAYSIGNIVYFSASKAIGDNDKTTYTPPFTMKAVRI